MIDQTAVSLDNFPKGQMATLGQAIVFSFVFLWCLFFLLLHSAGLIIFYW